MKKPFALLFLILAFAPALAFAHAGEVHSYMGTITTLQKDGSFTLTKVDGQTMRVQVAKTTTYRHADGHAANATELNAGSRVVVMMSKDGKTAMRVTMAAARKK